MLHEIFDYNKAMNEALIHMLLDNTDVDVAKSRYLFSHILNAHHIWNCRIQYQPIVYGVFQEHAVDHLQAINEENYRISAEILQHTDKNQVITYTNTEGQEFQNTVSDILFHIANHSNYHRAQIASDFRANEIQPLVSDYIFYKR